MSEFKPGSQPQDLRRLLENGSWVRRLAVRLLRDESLADDVLQEVWITAIQRPPSKPEALRAWLSKVVRSLCLRANRSLLRRKHLEERGRNEPRAPSPQDVEERLESQRRLLEAVLALEEPYRSVVYLHFYEGLKLVEIARIQGATDSTVRTQLARGLDKLRERLESDFGGRGEMLALLLALVLPADLLVSGRAAAASAPLATRSASGTGGPSPVPLVSRSASRRFFLALSSATVLLTSLCFLWVASRERTPADGEVKGIRAASEAAEVGPRAGVIARAVGPSPARTVESFSRAVGAVRVIVRDASSGQPIPGARVYRAPLTHAHSTLMGKAGVDGAILVDDPEALRDPWFMLAEGYVERREPAARRDAEGGVPGAVDWGIHVIELEPEFPARVVVLDQDGAPAARVPVTVLARLRGAGAVEPVSMVTDPRGEATYTFRYVDTTVRIALDGYVGLSLPAETPRMTVRLRRGRPVEGLAIGPGGSPAARCQVQVESASLKSPIMALADALGAFSLGLLDPSEEVTLRFRAPGLPAYRFAGRPPESGPWRFCLPDGVMLSGVVSRPDGKPASGGHVFVLVPEADGSEGPEGPAAQVRPAGLPPSERSTRRLVTRARAAIGGNGRFELGPIVAGGGDEYLFVHHPDHGRHLELLEAREPGALLAITLPRGVTVTGTLMKPDGAPLAGALLHFGETWSNGVECVIGRTRAGADGSFTFRGMPAGAGQPLPGAWGLDGAETVRSSVFVAAFAPDVILERADRDSWAGGRADSGADSRDGREVSPGAFEISDALSGGTPLRLIGAAREHLAALNVRLRDHAGLPVRAVTRAVLVDCQGGVHAGLLGRNLRGARFFSDETLVAERLDRADLVLMPEGYRWRAVPGLDLRENGAIDVTLEPRSGIPCRLGLLLPGGEAAARWPVLVGLPFGAARPRAAQLLGTTDDKGGIDLGALPPGRHAVALPFGREASLTATSSAEAIAGRVAWGQVLVADGGYQELVCPCGEGTGDRGGPAAATGDLGAR